MIASKSGSGLESFHEASTVSPRTRKIVRLARVRPLYSPSTPQAVAASRSQSETSTGVPPSESFSAQAAWLKGESTEMPSALMPAAFRSLLLSRRSCSSVVQPPDQSNG